MENMAGFIGSNFHFRPEGIDLTVPTTSEGMKTSSWVVLMHSPGIGTFAPSFPNIDDAEEFANAMRVITDDLAISEPIPVVKTKTFKVDREVTKFAN